MRDLDRARSLMTPDSLNVICCRFWAHAASIRRWARTAWSWCPAAVSRCADALDTFDSAHTGGSLLSDRRDYL